MTAQACCSFHLSADSDPTDKPIHPTPWLQNLVPTAPRRHAICLYAKAEGQWMSVKPEALVQLLSQAVEEARAHDTELNTQVSQQSETENDTVCMDVYFGGSTSQPSLVLNQLTNRLDQESTLGTIEVFGPPHSRVTLAGAVGSLNYRITIHLESETPRPT